MKLKMANLEHFDFEIGVEQAEKVFGYCSMNNIYFRAQGPLNGVCKIDVWVKHIDEWEKLVTYLNSISEW